MATSTVEADQEPQSPLLSLSGSVDSLLLAYVSSGEGGLKAILNLREVCSTTKTWVDGLPPPQAKRIFGKCQAKLNLNRVYLDSENTVEHDQEASLEFIEDFLENPSPVHVTSLSLSGMKFFAAAPLSRNDKKIWRRFAVFWWERLECLEVDYFDKFLRPISSLVNQLLSAPDLHTLRCRQLGSLEAEFPLELPQRFFHMEHLQIDTLKLPAFWETQISESLSRAPRLKSLKLPVYSKSFQRAIANFVVVTKNRLDLAVVFSMDTDDYTVASQQKLDLSFVSAVAASSASIRIRKLLACRLRNLQEIAGVETAKQFFKSVETLRCFKPTSIDDSRLLDFPNLKELSLPNSGTEKNISLPPSLEELTMSGWPQSFPPNLTSFTTYGYRSSVSELMDSFSSLDEQCPLLNYLQITWVGDKTLETLYNFCTDGSCSSHQDSPSTTTPFRNLKTLYIDLDASFLEDPNARPHKNLNGARWILLNGLKLAQLSLEVLDFVFDPNFKKWSTENGYKAPPVFDRCALSSLIEGKIAKSLQHVLIEDSCVAEDAISLMEKLKSLAEENSEKIL